MKKIKAKVAWIPGNVDITALNTNSTYLTFSLEKDQEVDEIKSKAEASCARRGLTMTGQIIHVPNWGWIVEVKAREG